jgi:hypothetical protein
MHTADEHASGRSRETGRAGERSHSRVVSMKVGHTPEPAIMQREHERSRVVIEGTRTDDGTRCSLVVVHEVGDMWALHPHGWDKFGVRLSKTAAVKMAQVILAAASE